MVGSHKGLPIFMGILGIPGPHFNGKMGIQVPVKRGCKRRPYYCGLSARALSFLEVSCSYIRNSEDDKQVCNRRPSSATPFYQRLSRDFGYRASFLDRGLGTRLIEIAPFMWGSRWPNQLVSSEVALHRTNWMKWNYCRQWVKLANFNGNKIIKQVYSTRYIYSYSWTSLLQTPLGQQEVSWLVWYPHKF